MSFLKKIKNMFSGTQAADVPSAPIEKEPEAPAMDEAALAEARKREEALLDKLSQFNIVDIETLSQNFLEMHIYRFEKPFDSADMRNLINGMRWLGFRLYTFSVLANGQEHDCESWQTFIRSLSEGEPEGCSLLTSFGGVRVNCTISADGTVHFSHDSSRGVDFSPFEGIFNPEEIEPEEE